MMTKGVKNCPSEDNGCPQGRLGPPPKGGTAGALRLRRECFSWVPAGPSRGAPTSPHQQPLRGSTNRSQPSAKQTLQSKNIFNPNPKLENEGVSNKTIPEIYVHIATNLGKDLMYSKHCNCL